MIQLILILALLLGAGGFFGWNYIEKIQLENQLLIANEVALQNSIKKQKEILRAQLQDTKEIQDANEELRKRSKILQKEKDNLTKKLSKHELDVLAQAKPGLVENIINNASKNAMRCVEILTGSPLTEDELSAVKKSEINQECPEIANPNYKEEE